MSRSFQHQSQDALHPGRGDVFVIASWAGGTCGSSGWVQRATPTSGDPKVTSAESHTMSTKHSWHYPHFITCLPVCKPGNHLAAPCHMQPQCCYYRCHRCDAMRASTAPPGHRGHVSSAHMQQRRPQYATPRTQPAMRGARPAPCAEGVLRADPMPEPCMHTR